jgi:predicted MFS family arabinose efflux permease
VYLSWRWIFFVNVPFGLVAIWLALRLMPDYRGERRPLDVPGFLLLAGAMGGLSWAFERASEGLSLLPFAVAGAALALFAAYRRHSRRSAAPILDLGLMRIASFRIAFTSGFATRLGVGGVYFLLTLLLQVGFGYSAIVAGLLQMPQAIAMIAMRFFVGGIIRQFGYRRVLLLNTALAGLLIVLFATLSATTPVWLICVQVFVYGFVMSLQYSAMNTLGFLDLAQSQASMGSSITSAVQNLSLSLGIAFASVLMAVCLGAFATDFVAAFRATVVVLGTVTLLSTLLFLRLPRGAAR